VATGNTSPPAIILSQTLDQAAKEKSNEKCILKENFRSPLLSNDLPLRTQKNSSMQTLSMLQMQSEPQRLHFPNSLNNNKIEMIPANFPIIHIDEESRKLPSKDKHVDHRSAGNIFGNMKLESRDRLRSEESRNRLDAKNFIPVISDPSDRKSAQYSDGKHHFSRVSFKSDEQNNYDQPDFVVESKSSSRVEPRDGQSSYNSKHINTPEAVPTVMHSNKNVVLRLFPTKNLDSEESKGIIRMESKRSNHSKHSDLSHSVMPQVSHSNKSISKSKGYRTLKYINLLEPHKDIHSPNQTGSLRDNKNFLSQNFQTNSFNKSIMISDGDEIQQHLERNNVSNFDFSLNADASMASFNQPRSRAQSVSKSRFHSRPRRLTYRSRTIHDRTELEEEGEDEGVRENKDLNTTYIRTNQVLCPRETPKDLGMIIKGKRTQINQYVLVKSLDKGGWGEVFLSIDMESKAKYVQIILSRPSR